MKHNKNILIANWAGVNSGDDAMFSSLMNMVGKEISNEAKIFVLADNDKLIKSKYRINDAMRIFDFYRVKNLKKLARIFKASDLLIYGGGDIINGNLKSMSFVGLALILGLPVMCCGVGVVPIKSPLKRFMTRIVVNQVNSITVRDEESKERLESLGVIKPEVIVTSDLAFLLPSTLNRENLLQRMNKQLSNSSLKIGMSIRPFDSMYHFYGVWNENILINHIANLCDYLVREYDASIIFIPMVLKQRCKEYHTNLEADDELSERIIRKMKNKHSTTVIKDDYAPEDILGLMSEMNLIIGARLHSLVLATRVGVPVIAIAYAPKIEAFMRSIDRSEFSLNVSELSENKLRDLCDKALEEKNGVKGVQIQRHVARAEINKREIEKILVGTHRKYWRFYLFLPAFVIVALLNYMYIWVHRLTNIAEK